MNLQIIEHSNQRVLTTAQLAEAYGTDPKNINDNFQHNKDRFTLGKHYFVLEGEELKKFKASTEISGNIKFAPMIYLWTEKGAWMQAKSLNTDEAWNAYESLVDDYYAKQAAMNKVRLTGDLAVKQMDAEAKLRNAKTRQGNLLLKMMDKFSEVLSPESKQTFLAHATELVSGKMIVPLPTLEERFYTATEIGEEIGISRNMIGRIAKKHNVQTEEFGKTFLDKSPYSPKQIASFRYNEKGKKKILELIKEEER